MLSFDQLVADRDALRAKGLDTIMLDAVIARREKQIQQAMKELLDRQAQQRENA